MKLIIENTTEQVADFAARYVVKKILSLTADGRYFVMGLPTGSTPLGMYKKLIEFHQQGIVSFKMVKTFNMDEYVESWATARGMGLGGRLILRLRRIQAEENIGLIHVEWVQKETDRRERSRSCVMGPIPRGWISPNVLFGLNAAKPQDQAALPRDHPESYHSFMFDNFFRHIDIDPVNIHILDGNTSNHEKECADYEKKITEAGGIDLFVGGIGPDGHIAFNEPGSSLASRTRIKTLNEDTIQANARFFGGDLSKVPTQALTVGVQTVMEAREVMILITGSHKALALHQAIECGISHMCTVSAMQMHKCAMFIADEDATLELKVKTVKYFKGLMGHHRKLVEF